MAEQYPNKRLIVHYLQPHAPYIGQTGQDLPTDYLNFWNSWKAGEFSVDLETVRQAYRENIELVIPHIQTLLNSLQGKTIITADHAELLGERDAPIPIKRYGHGEHTYISELVEVPWLVHQNGNRKEIHPENESQNSRKEVSEEALNDRLADLGYIK